MLAGLVGCASKSATTQSSGWQAEAPIAKPKQTLVQSLADQNSIFLKTNTEKKLIEIVKSEIKEGLKDPSSAQFKDVRIVKVPEGKVVCGQVNAKNSYGGYAGYKYFIASAQRQVLEQRGEVWIYDALEYACTKG